MTCVSRHSDGATEAGELSAIVGEIKEFRPHGTSPTAPKRVETRLSMEITTPSSAPLQQASVVDVPKPAKLADRDRTILDHLHLVKTIAFSIRRSLPVHVDLDDLAAAGVIGLIDAANKYDGSKQVAFPNYAKHRIRGAILDSLRQLDWASRDMRRQQKLVAKAISELATILERNPSDIEIAERVGIDLATCHRSMTALNSGGPVSISHFATDDGAFATPDYPAAPTTHPDFLLGRKELLGVLKEGVRTLPERQQKVVTMYYENDMSMKQIGSLLGINESRVSQIHKSAISKMADHFKSKGITVP